MYPANLKGENGCEFLTDGETASAIGCAFTCLTDTVLTSITMPKGTGTANIVGNTISEGTTIFGTITELTISTGLVQFFAESQQADTRG